jgi:hypothetical protein
MLYGGGEGWGGNVGGVGLLVGQEEGMELVGGRRLSLSQGRSLGFRSRRCRVVVGGRFGCGAGVVGGNERSHDRDRRRRILRLRAAYIPDHDHDHDHPR